MSITLRDITGDNYFQVLELKISPEQEAAKFVSPVVRSLADAWFYREEGITYPKAIYADEDLVGFIMYELDTAEATADKPLKQYWKWPSSKPR